MLSGASRTSTSHLSVQRSIGTPCREDITHCGRSTPDASGGRPLMRAYAILFPIGVPPFLTFAR